MSRLSLSILAICIFAQIAVAEDDNTSKITRGNAVELALKHNSEVKRAEELIEEQIGEKIYTRSFILPKFEYIANFTMTDRDLLNSFNDQTFGTNRDWDMRVEVRQPLFTGGRGSNTYKANKLREKAARYALQQVANDSIYSAQKLYLDVLLARETLKVQRNSVFLLGKLAKDERNKFEAGSVSKLNLLRAEVALANSRAPYIKAKNDLKLTQEEFNRFIADSSDGLSPVDYASRIEGKLNYVAYEVALPVILERAMTSRPEIKRFKLLIEAAERGIDAEFASYIPDITTTASYNIQKNRFTEELDDTLRGWRLGFDANWNIFDSLETYGKMKQARSRTAIAKIDYKQSVLDIGVEVRRAHADLQEARALVRASDRVVAQANEAYKLAKARFNAGAATQNELLDAQVAFKEAQLNRAESLYQHNLAGANIQRVTAAAVRYTEKIEE